jgi:hypothetical protein
MNDSIQNYVKPEPFETELPVELTDTELLQRGKRAAIISKDIANKISALDTLKQSYKAQVKELESERERIEFEQREGVKQQLVRCERRFVYRTGEVQEVRLDTGEIMNVRPMNERERQPDLPGLGKPKAAAEDFMTPEDDDDSTGTGGSSLDDPDEDSDSPVVENDYASDTDESPDTSLLDDDASLAQDQADSAAGRGTDGEPELQTQKKKRAPRGEGKGSRGGKAKS